MEIARLYRAAQQSFVALVADLEPDGWATPVPCNPGWSVRDVLSHVAGVTDDALHQRLDGAATEPWTAAQVERWRDVPAEALIAQWNDQIGPVAEAVEAFEQRLPVFDLHSHEHDVRHALGRPGNRDSEIVALIAKGMARQGIGRPIHVTDAGLDLPGEGDPVQLDGVDAFELGRSRLGRRSRQQVAGYRWSSPLSDAELDAWFWFGPSPIAIDE